MSDHNHPVDDSVPRADHDESSLVSTVVDSGPSATPQISAFTESFESFSRVVNSLQRRYLELRQEFQDQQQELVDANAQLAALTESNLAVTEFLDNILSSLSAGVIAIDRDSIITHINPAAAALWGVTPDTARGKPYATAVPVFESSDADEATPERAGRSVGSEERRLHLSDGRQVCISVSTAILRGRDGIPTGAVEVWQDVTKLRRMEQELARLNTLAALGEMAATIAHEVRNPLSAIGGFAALLDRDLDEADPNRRTVRKIIKGVERLNQTVATLLNYTRFQQLSRVNIDYHKYLTETVSQFCSEGGQRLTGVEIVVQPLVTPPGRKTFVQADTVLMRQVLTNILDNAVECMNGAGKVTITCRWLALHEIASPYRDRILLGGGDTVLETVIRDTGPGIHEHHLERIFAPFFSTRSGGNGLGLAVVWKIIKAHGGEVFAANSPEGGAEIHLLLPAPG